MIGQDEVLAAVRRVLKYGRPDGVLAAVRRVLKYGRPDEVGPVLKI